MCRTCKIVAWVHTWQFNLLPSSSSPTSGISPHVIPTTDPRVWCSPPCIQVLSLFSTCLWVRTCIFHFLFLCRFAENDILQIYPCPYKGHELIIFDCCIIFHGVYMPHFPSPIYHRWAFGLVSGLCYCKQCCSEHSCASVLTVEWFIVLWIYAQ